MPSGRNRFASLPPLTPNRILANWLQKRLSLISESPEPEPELTVKTKRAFIANLVVGVLALLLILGLVIIGVLLYQWLH